MRSRIDKATKSPATDELIGYYFGRIQSSTLKQLIQSLFYFENKKLQTAISENIRN